MKIFSVSLSLCARNPPVTGRFPSQRASNRKMFPFDDVIMMTISTHYASLGCCHHMRGNIDIVSVSSSIDDAVKTWNWFPHHWSFVRSPNVSLMLTQRSCSAKSQIISDLGPLCDVIIMVGSNIRSCSLQWHDRNIWSSRKHEFLAMYF